MFCLSCSLCAKCPAPIHLENSTSAFSTSSARHFSYEDSPSSYPYTLKHTHTHTFVDTYFHCTMLLVSIILQGSIWFCADCLTNAVGFPNMPDTSILYYLIDLSFPKIFLNLLFEDKPSFLSFVLYVYFILYICTFISGRCMAAQLVNTNVQSIILNQKASQPL